MNQKIRYLAVSLFISILLFVGCDSFNKSKCPQFNVSMIQTPYDITLRDQTYDGWVIHGEATCKKGNHEGENLNYYYCGGYNYVMGIGKVNAYISKTPVSNDGQIGKTVKYVILNVYDEKKQFIETRCLGDPDEFDKKQAEAFEREMMKWN